MIPAVKKYSRKTAKIAIGLLMILVITGRGNTQATTDRLKNGFENPPSSARPRVWWHWLDGNIAKDGIKLDLEWMKRSGIGGFQNFDATMSSKVVDKPLIYMSPEWKDAFRYATSLADTLGLEEAIASSPGFSETGGPWVKPNEAMKKYVWSEVRVQGGQTFHGVLPHPPSNTGAFQNLPIEDVGQAFGGGFHAPRFYADAAVVAFRVPASEVLAQDLHPAITSSNPIDVSVLSDGDLVKTTSLEMPETAGQRAWIRYDFEKPETIRGITIIAGRRSPFEGYLPAGRPSGISVEYSEDGAAFKKIVDLTKGGTTEHTVSFTPVTARYFRVSFGAPPPPAPGSDAAKFGVDMRPPKTVPIAELVLHPGARVDEFEEKAAFTPAPDLYQFSTPIFDKRDVIDRHDVIDLTSRMKADGTLDWTPPAGDWVIMRLGYSLLGIINHPANKAATGLEVDKLNSTYVKSYMDRYLGLFADTVDKERLGPRGIGYMVSDSWEAGAQNWTDDMLEQFQRRRGYDPRPWLPVLAGFVVGSSQASDGFLWDLRKTIADLTAEAHYGQMEKSLAERGMKHYGESHENGRAMIADGMEVKKFDDIPMSAMWAQSSTSTEPPYDYNADDRESASVAHIYGKPVAAAESFTTCDSKTAWMWTPAMLKPTADLEFLNGINRIVVHLSVHQPLLNKAPGISFGPCGQWFTRNETWANEAGTWMAYLARNSYLLQQGHNVADILYFYGEDSNVAAIFHSSAPDLPQGYSFDYVNADALIHAFSVVNGQLTTHSGMHYRVLVLDKYSKHMSLPVLRAIYGLVQHGAIVVGERPVDTPSLADDQAKFQKLASELFGASQSVRTVGKGKLYAPQDLLRALRDLHIAPDFSFQATGSDQRVEFVHRSLPDAQVYFVANRRNQTADVVGSFRTSGRAPEIWHAEDGTTESVSFRRINDRTEIPLHLDPWQSYFIVFRGLTKAKAHEVAKRSESLLLDVHGPWTIDFQPKRGAPEAATIKDLTSWTESDDKGIKYFSGEATYHKEIEAQPEWFRKGTRLLLDLGDVRNLAAVTVNGNKVATVWHAPYRIDITESLRPGKNAVSIKVINAWVNRMIGDQQTDAPTKYTFSTIKPYRADTPLLPSGLLGPVRLLQSSRQ